MTASSTSLPLLGLDGGRGTPIDSTRIQSFQHEFHRHPAMELGSLRRLAHALRPTRQCRFLKPGTTQTSEFHHEGQSYDGRGIDEVFDRLAETGSWIALYNVETVPEYADFLAEVMRAAQPLLGGQQPGIFNVGGFLFASAPPSVTPFHIDRENNFWLQIAGRKRMLVWDHRDRDVVAGRAVEDFIVTRSLDQVRLRDDLRARARVFDVGPGDGVYFPATSPHATETSTDWVRPGDAVSISIGVVFYSDVTRRQARVHQLNRVLRKAGLEPTPPGQSAWRDAAKAPLGALAAQAQQRLQGYKPPPGSC